MLSIILLIILIPVTVALITYELTKNCKNDYIKIVYIIQLGLIIAVLIASANNV